MTFVNDLVVLDPRAGGAASCIVCGNDIAPGEGVTARYEDRTLRFKCPGCLARFEADPERFLTGAEAGCCGNGHDHSPDSEWACDR
ncbi:MAG: hypothetical protein AABZ33_05385 [Chloroflexota bacterium]